MKNEWSLFTGLCHFLSALQSHCKADMLKRKQLIINYIYLLETWTWKSQMGCKGKDTYLIQPSKVPGRKGTPIPASSSTRSPSTSLSFAMSEKKIGFLKIHTHQEKLWLYYHHINNHMSKYSCVCMCTKQLIIVVKRKNKSKAWNRHSS